MKATIDVRDRAEADRIKTAMNDETTRAVMNVMGALMPLSDKDRRRVFAGAGQSRTAQLRRRTGGRGACHLFAMRGRVRHDAPAGETCQRCRETR